MNLVWPTTKPTLHDTRFTARAKLLQQINNPTDASAGPVIVWPTTKPNLADTRLIAMQKALQLLQ